MLTCMKYIFFLSRLWSCVCKCVCTLFISSFIFGRIWIQILFIFNWTYYHDNILLSLTHKNVRQEEKCVITYQVINLIEINCNLIYKYILLITTFFHVPFTTSRENQPYFEMLRGR